MFYIVVLALFVSGDLNAPALLNDPDAFNAAMLAAGRTPALLVDKASLQGQLAVCEEEKEASFREKQELLREIERCTSIFEGFTSPLIRLALQEDSPSDTPPEMSEEDISRLLTEELDPRIETMPGYA